MKGLSQSLIIAPMLSAILVVSGCAVYPAHNSAGYGPPPHAPAHGYRHKHQGHDIEYDSSLGVYAVIGFNNYYFYDNNYYKRDHDRWYYSRDLDRNWRDYNENKLPPGLAKRYGHRDNDRDEHTSNRNNSNRGHSYRDDHDRDH